MYKANANDLRRLGIATTILGGAAFVAAANASWLGLETITKDSLIAMGALSAVIAIFCLNAAFRLR